MTLFGSMEEDEKQTLDMNMYKVLDASYIHNISNALDVILT